MKTLRFRHDSSGFQIGLDDEAFIRHTREAPFISIGSGRADFEMHRGNFQITPHLDELIALRDFKVLENDGSALRLRLFRGAVAGIDLRVYLENERLVVRFSNAAAEGSVVNRFSCRLAADEKEHVYGCGEQFSYFDLRGKNFPLWTSEQGVGRNKLTEITRLADLYDKAGGDYYWTFFPQTSFVSSRKYWCYLETSAYAEFDFRARECHGLSAWDLPASLVIGAADSMPEVLTDQSGWFGRQGDLPDWCHEGIVLGIQGGMDICLEKLEKVRKAGVSVAGIWAQDWQGINMTSFGQRLRWNWVWDRERYPGLDREIPRLKAQGVRFLGYINPYVGAGMSLHEEASARGFLAKNASGADYDVDFGEFYAGIVDLTNPDAFEWYKGVIRRNLIEFGLSGWMADFGEYLPTDTVLFDGSDAEKAHNAWPALWARCNREAVDEAERDGLAAPGEIVYFMRAGGPGSQKHCPLMWAGDQNVDWSEDDGLPSVLPAALSLGMSGHGLHHSDIGGYTTVLGMKRTKELFMRWAELAAFTVFMRSHEGNRPKDNWHFDSDAGTMAHLAVMTRLHAGLAPYIRAVVAENSRSGLPAMRPLFIHDEADEKAWSIKDEFLFGSDLLVAPILKEGAQSRRVHFPHGRWIHLWSGRVHEGAPQGEDPEIDAPLGRPCVFAREGSPWMSVFTSAFRDAGRGS